MVKGELFFMNESSIISAINDAGGLSINLVTQTEASQFWIMVGITLMGSIFALFIMWGYLRPSVATKVLRLRLRKYCKKNKRHVVIVKHTSSGLFSQSMIDVDTIMKFEKIVRGFKGEPFDLVLHTPGGVVFPTQVLAKAIRIYRENVKAVIPVYAMSGGTILAFATDEILMGPYASLGPVDPQLSSLFSFGSARAYDEVIRKKGTDAKDESIRMAFMGEQIRKSISEKFAELVEPHMESDDEDTCKMVVETFTNGELPHGELFSIEDLREMSIKVTELDNDYHSNLTGIITSDMFEGVYGV